METCNASTVKVIDEVPIHHTQMNRMPASQAPNNQMRSYPAQPSYFRGGQQGGNGRGRPIRKGVGAMYVARDWRDARGGNFGRGPSAGIESTTALAIMQTIGVTQTMVATMIGLRIGTRMSCILFTMSSIPGPYLMQVVGHVAM